MGSIKDRNGRDLTEAEDIKKRWQEYTDELYKKGLHNPDNQDGVITHLETNILEVKWALGSITTKKASGGDGIPVELFQILKDDAVKVLHSICREIWKTQQRPQDWKMSVFIPVPKKGNAKECSMDMGLGGLRELVMDREAWHSVVHGVAKRLKSDWTELNWIGKIPHAGEQLSPSVQFSRSVVSDVHQVSDAIQPSPLLSPSPPALNLSQHQGLFKWVTSSHQVAKALEFQLQHQSFQWKPRTDLL